MKTKEELNVLKEKVKNPNNKLAELNEEELEQVTGGAILVARMRDYKLPDAEIEDEANEADNY